MIAYFDHVLTIQMPLPGFEMLVPIRFFCKRADYALYADVLKFGSLFREENN